MGAEDDIGATVAHIVLCFVAGRGISRISGKSFTHPGMHANFALHGVIGILHYNSGTFGDVTAAYTISTKAARFLALPCLMADLYHDNANLSAVHLISGLIPFVLALSGRDNPQLGNVVIALNIISLCHYSMQHDKEWGWYTAASGLFAYFVAPPTGVKVLFPLGLALMEFCAYKLFHINFDPPSVPQKRRF